MSRARRGSPALGSTAGEEGRGDVLLVEDNPALARLLGEAFEEALVDAEFHAVTRGSEGLDFLYRRGEYERAPRPDIVLLDLNLVGTNGLELLDEVKHEAPPEVRAVPVIVLTSSTVEEEIFRAYSGHANAFLRKPDDLEGYVDLARSISDFWLRSAELPHAPRDPSAGPGDSRRE